MIVLIIIGTVVIFISIYYLYQRYRRRWAVFKLVDHLRTSVRKTFRNTLVIDKESTERIDFKSNNHDDNNHNNDNDNDVNGKKSIVDDVVERSQIAREVWEIVADMRDQIKILGKIKVYRIHLLYMHICQMYEHMYLSHV